MMNELRSTRPPIIRLSLFINYIQIPPIFSQLSKIRDDHLMHAVPSPPKFTNRDHQEIPSGSDQSSTYRSI